MAEPTAGAGRPVVFLHVGTMKTGTTYLQQRMYANRDALAAAGMLLPGTRWGHQVRAVQDLLSLDRWDPHVRRDRRGAWQALADEARATTLPVALISVEFLAGARPRQIRRTVTSLAPAEVHVVFTVRDMTRVLPALWQTQVHNGARYSWPEFLARVARPRRMPRLPLQQHRPEDVFRNTQDVPAMLDRWSAAVGADRLHVVTVPRSGADPDELWRRFATVVGVDPTVATEPPAQANASTGLAATELVRRVNQHLGRLRQSEYNWTVKEFVALRALARRSDREGRARLDRRGYDLALRWNAAVRDAVRALGTPVTGDLEDLPTTPDPEARAALPAVPTGPSRRQMLVDALVAARALHRLRRRRARQLRELGVDAHPPARTPPAELRREWQAADDPVDAAAAWLAESAREAALLLRAVRRARSDASGTRARGGGLLRR